MPRGTPGADSFTAPAGNSSFDGLGGVDTINFNFKLADATFTWIGNQVIVDTATSHTVLTGFEKYVFTDGTVNDDDGDPLVDDLYYYSRYHDVWNAHVDADLHYHLFGWKEGRDPDAFFSTSEYLTANPDIKAAGVDPLVQFDQTGWRQGRVPSINFDPQHYLLANPDVKAAGVDPLKHFLEVGGGEGRQPYAPLTYMAPNGFDYIYYLQHNPDVAKAGADPYLHYETVGWKEGRNPNAYFDTQGYLATYTDVAKAGVNPLDHFHQSGWKEGRISSPLFDPQQYLAHNPDVAAAHVDPLLHYLQSGIYEGRVAYALPVIDIDGSADSVIEGAAAGAHVGLTIAWGGWKSPSLFYTLAADSSGGGFAIDASTGVITVLDGSRIDFENAPGHAYTVTVTAHDAGQTSTQTFTIAVADAAPALPASQAPIGNVDEMAANGTAVGITFTATDPNGPGATYSLSDNAGGRFAIDPHSGVVTVANGAAIDYETAPGHAYTITAVATAGALSTSETFTINVNDVNEAPTAVAFANVVAIDENVNVGTGIRVADVVVTDDTLGTNVLSLSGADSASFELRGKALYFVGASPDFETKSSYAVTVNVDDASVGGTPDAAKNFILTVNDVNEAPTALAFANVTAAIDENTDTSAGVKVADIVVTDDALGNNALNLSGTDAGSFEIRNGNELYYVGKSPDFETKSHYQVTVNVDDASVGASPDASKDFTLTINDVNEAPTAVSFISVAALDENVAVGTGIKVADVVVTDDALGTNTLSLSGADSTSFEIRNGHELYFIGASPDFETKASYSVTVNADDATVGTNPDAAKDFTLAINDVNEAPTAVAFANVSASIDENTDTSGGIKVADIVVTDDALGTDALSLSGADSASFAIRNGHELYFVGTSPDFETKSSYHVTVSVDDASVGASPDATKDFTLTINDVNEAPTAVSFANVTAAIDENTDTSAGIKVADIVVADDALGTNVLGLSGADSASFEIRNGHELYYVGTSPDFEAQASYSVTVGVDDASVGASPDASRDFTLSINDVNEAPTAVSFANVTASIDENVAVGTGIKVADIVVTDDALGTNLLTLTGTDSAAFAIRNGHELYFIGASPDFETKSSYLVTVNVDDAGVGVSPDATRDFTLTVNDVNEAPTAVAFANATSIDENVTVGAGIKVADIVVTDDALGTNVLSLSGSDAASFEIRNGTELYYVGASPDFETKSSYTVTVNVDDAGVGGSPDASQDFTLAINDVNEAPAAVAFANGISLDENVTVGTGIKVADIVVADDALGANVLSLTGSDAASFAIRNGTELFYIGTSPDFEAKPSYTVTVNVDDASVGGSPDASRDFTLAVNDVNEAPTAVSFANGISIDENVTVGTGIKVADIVVTDDALGTNVLSLSGTDAASFAIRNGTELYYVGASPDFEAKSSYAVTVNVDDASVGGSPDASKDFILTVNDVNEAPTAISFANGISIDENVTVGTGIKVADIVVTDDALGTNVLSLSGTDAVSFAIRNGTELYYIGASPDFEAKSSYSVTVSVDDAGVGASPDASKDFTLSVNDVNEAPTAVSFANATAALDENVTVGTGIKVADIVVADDALGTNVLSLSGADAVSFAIRNGHELYYVGASPNFEAKPGYSVTVNVDDASVGATPDASKDFTLTINDVNEAPTAVSFANVTAAIDENVTVGTGIKVADIVVTDDALGTNVLSLSGTDAASFAIRNGHELYFVGTSPDFETKSSYHVTINVDDASVGASPDATKDFTLVINDVNEAPTAVSFANAATALDENVTVGTGIKVADIVVADDALGIDVLSLSGADAASFAIRNGNQLYYIGASPDFEAKQSYSVTVSVDDASVGTSPDASKDFTLTINDVNEAPTAVSFANTTTAIDENITVGTGIKVADIVVTDDALGTNVLSVSGADSAAFAIRNGHELFFIGASPDFESKSSYLVTVNVDDAGVGVSPDATRDFTLTVNDVNEAPTAVAFANATSIDENVTVGAGIKVADIVVADDALGTNALSLSGTDAASFEIRNGTELYYVGASPDFETKPSYTVTVNVDDATVGGNPDASKDFTLSINDVNEAPTAVAFANATTAIDENVTVGIGIKVADIVVADDALGTNVLSLSGADAASFAIRNGTELFYVGNSPDFEAKASYSVTVSVDDAAVGGSPDAGQDFKLTINDVNEAPTAVSFANATSIDENVTVGTGIKVADIVVTDDALGTNVLSLSGTDAASFAIRNGTELFYVGNSPDFEAKSSYSVTVNVDDPSVGATPDGSKDFTLTINDVNEAPTAVSFANATAIDENVTVGAGIKVADIVVTDDAPGTNVLSLSGTDAASFAIRNGTELY